MARFLPGHVFSITWHPRGDVNAEWFITAARHHGEQPGVLEHEAPSSEPGAGRGLRYSSQIQAIPQSARYVPQWEHPKRREDGLQSAMRPLHNGLFALLLRRASSRAKVIYA